MEDSNLIEKEENNPYLIIAFSITFRRIMCMPLIYFITLFRLAENLFFTKIKLFCTKYEKKDSQY